MAKVTPIANNISDTLIQNKGVQALANKPNLTSQYGISGLSGAELRAHFDKLATLIAGRVNEIINNLSSETATSYIRVALDSLEVGTLADLIEAFSDGRFAASLLKLKRTSDGDTELESLQTIMNDVALKISSLDETTVDHKGRIEELEKFSGQVSIREIQGEFVNITPSSNVWAEVTVNGNTYQAIKVEKTNTALSVYNSQNQEILVQKFYDADYLYICVGDEKIYCTIRKLNGINLIENKGMTDKQKAALRAVMGDKGEQEVKTSITGTAPLVGTSSVFGSSFSGAITLPDFTPNFGSASDWSKTIEIDRTRASVFKDGKGNVLLGKITSYQLVGGDIKIVYDGEADNDGVETINYEIPVKMKCEYEL